MSGTDIIDLAAGLPAHSPVAALRRQRPDFVRHGQGSHDVLIAPADPAGVSLIERAAAALRVAVIEHDAALAAYYRGRLRDIGADASTIAAAEQGREANAISPRFDAIQRHVTMIASTPGSATRQHLDALGNAGLAPRDVVTIAQIVAFVSYQIRVTAGLRILAEELRV